MREVLLSSKRYSYLDPTSIELLDQARHEAFETGLAHFPVIEVASECRWFTWTGTREQRLLVAALEMKGVEAVEESLALRVPMRAGDFLKFAKEVCSNFPTSRELARFIEPKQRRKYDRYLSDDLLEESLAADVESYEEALQLFSYFAHAQMGDTQ